VGAVLMSASTVVVALNAQLLRRVNLRPRPVSGTESTVTAGARGRRLGLGVAGRVAAVGIAVALAFGAGVLVGSTFGDDDGFDTAEQAVTVKGLTSSESGYTFEVLTPSLPPQAPAEFRFRIVGPDGVLRAYRDRHERPLHLILVSRDLGVFRHVHPSLGGDGIWQVGLDPLPPGPYRAFADFAAADGPELTLGHELTVTGEPAPRPVPAPSSTAVVDGYQVELTGRPRAGGEGEVSLTVRRDGRPVADLEPYLGALGHLVAIRASDLAYLHVHPLEGRVAPGQVPFAVEAPSAGTYRLFFDFAHYGTVRTAAFTVEVADGQGATPTTAGHGGGH
jgi:hypothetical protein